MLNFELNKAMAENIDKLVLYTLHRRIPDSFEVSYHDSPTFEAVLAETKVNVEKTAVYKSAPTTVNQIGNSPAANCSSAT